MRSGGVTDLGYFSGSSAVPAAAMLYGGIEGAPLALRLVGIRKLLCGSDHELLMAKSRLKLKEVGKTTSPFRYDINQIPYDYTVEVRNRSKELDLRECLKNYGWRFMTLYRRP